MDDFCAIQNHLLRRWILYSSEDGTLLYDTLVDIGVREEYYHATYHQGHFYLLGKGYDSASSDPQDYQYQIFKFSVEEPLSANDKVQTGQSLRIFPNPTNGEIMFHQRGEFQVESATLYNLTGDVVFAEKMLGQKEGLDLSALPDGIYFLKIKDNSGEVFIEKVALQKL